MDYPYDDGLDADTKTFLAAFRSKQRYDEPAARIAELIREEMPADLKAWLHTYAHHGGEVSLYDVILSGHNCQPMSQVTEDYSPEELAEVKREGIERLDMGAAVAMGNTADGEVSYAAAWAEGDPHLTLVKYCMSGYEDDGFIALGPLIEGMRQVADNIEDVDAIDEEVRELLVR